MQLTAAATVWRIGPDVLGDGQLPENLMVPVIFCGRKDGIKWDGQPEIRSGDGAFCITPWTAGLGAKNV
jgi:hypothetical protein